MTLTPQQMPTTLRSLAGLPNSVPDLADTTVVVIDAQQAYGHTGPLALDGVDAAAGQIARLLAAARDRGAAVIHVAHVGGSGSPFDPQDGGRFLRSLTPREDEFVVHKHLPNAFAGTDLLEQLTKAGDQPLVLSGFMTHMCVSSTARAALDLGLETVVASDATATRSLPRVNGGGAVPADAVQASALAAMADRFSVVATVDRLVGGA